MQRFFNDEWVTKYVDTDWETKFTWEREPLQTGNETANIFTNLFKTIANALGVFLDITHALDMHDNGQLTLPDDFQTPFEGTEDM